MIQNGVIKGLVNYCNAMTAIIAARWTARHGNDVMSDAPVIR